MSLTDDWKKAVIDFRARAGQFLKDVETLRAQRTEINKKYPAFKRDYNELIERSDTIYNTISKVTKGVDKVAEWLGLDMSNIESSQMGAIPLIPIAIITGAIAAMGKWASDVYIFNQRLAEVKRLEAKGISPARASQIAIKAPAGAMESLGRNVLGPIVPIVLLGLGLWAYNQSQKRR